MSRKDEDRILHGLHYFRESLDEEFTVTSEQILWLAAHSFADGSGWHKDGELQGFDCSAIPIELRRKLLMSKFELPLRYLNYRRLIKLTPAGDETVNVAVTFAGADRAMRLHTRLGRMELWYHENRDGFLGIVMTMAVSFVTALIAVAIVEQLRRGFSEPTPVIYESDPRSQP
ncbi:MAG TPA: hypothetical protein VKP66_12945 [Steroidobacteraceae bacterium]|nr:hypothetical protein [Steroidobacteraceae bacterium]